jgi:hypothetical protein
MSIENTKKGGGDKQRNLTCQAFTLGATTRVSGGGGQSFMLCMENMWHLRWWKIPV